MKKYLLGIDLGSGSVKLTLLTKEGRIAATEVCEYPTIYPCVGWAEQMPQAWRTALHTGIVLLLKSAGISADEIAAIAPDAATHTTVLLDEEGVPLENAILWTDQRSAREVEYLNNNYMETIQKITLNTPTTVWSLPQLMWVKKNRPEVWGRVRHLLFAKDYLRYCLTGALGTDGIDAMGSMLFDVEKECWSEVLCKIAGIPMHWLPRIYAPESLAGYVTKDAAGEFELCEGTPVFIGSTDTVLEQLAAGSVEIGHGTVKLATAGRICVISDHQCPSPFLFNYRHVVQGLWYPGTATSSCAASYRWFRDVLGEQSYDSLDDGAYRILPGSEGLMFHPYLQGELTPYNDSKLRSSFVGISSRHTKAHFTRAVLEGVAYSLKDCVETLKQEQLKMLRTRIIGGGARSPLWRQIVADVLGREVEKAEVDDSSFGAAMLAGVGIGWFTDFKDAAERCVRIQTITYPDETNKKIYASQFLKYKKIHDALAPIYHDEI
jgi:xylulokinase